MKKSLITILFGALATCTSSGDISKNDTAPASDFDQAVHNATCREPSDLTKRVIETYAPNPERIRVAAENSGYADKIHLYRAIGDTVSADTVAREIFRERHEACFGFTPAKEDYIAAANEVKDVNPKKAFDFLGKAHDRAAQLKLVEGLEFQAIYSPSLYDTALSRSDLLVKMYTALGETEQAERIPATFFMIIPRLVNAEEYLRRQGVDPTADLYKNRGDYWSRHPTPTAEIVSASFEAYQKAVDLAETPYLQSRSLDAVRSLLPTAESVYPRVALEMALAVSDKEAALRIARKLFQEESYLDKDDLGRIAQAGVQITPNDYSAKGDRLRRENNFGAALDAYRAAGDQIGIQQVLQNFTDKQQ